jgi:hypothetical protein
MLKLRDLYTLLIPAEITSSGTPVGQAMLQYEVHRYIDTKNLKAANAYLVTCTQRLIVPNAAAYALSTTAVQSYSHYPALLIANITVNDPDDQVLLVDYFPRTLNTSVNTASNSTAGTNTTASQQYTSGSSTAQTNSFGTSYSLGFFGDAPTGGVSSDFSASASAEQSSATSSGTAVDTSNQQSSSSAMSVKDWGSYAQLSPASSNLTWIWGQEYPWNVIQFNAPNATKSAVLLPDFVQQRLLDTSDADNPVLYPPSELSLLGVDFVSKATWLITPPPANAGSDTISFTHNLTLGYATHGMTGNQVTASLDAVNAAAIQSGTIDLPLYGLDPLSGAGPAVIGFVPDQFVVAPTSSGSPFAIAADANDLLARGTGFTSVMATDFSAGAVQLTVYFKVIEPNTDISLSLKNWLEGTVPCKLTIAVNGQTPLVRYVDAPETSGGSDNITVVTLRYKDYTSVNYCDYLQMGLNQVSITIAPTASTPATSYQLLAVAVG